MKKITAIFFLTAYLFSTTEAQQLWKLPVIFEHYSEHRKEGSTFSLLQFLDIHYMHGSPRDNDYERDMQLPFKTAGDCALAISPAFVPVFLQHTIPAPIELRAEKTPELKDFFLLSSYLAQIWQPPKLS